MSATLTEIKGVIKIDISANTPLRSLQVDLYATTENVGWIAGTQTDLFGQYALYFDEARVTAINAIGPVMELRFKYGDIVIHTEALGDLLENDDRTIDISASAYEEAVSDRDLTLPEEPTYTIITGRVLDKNGRPIVATIRIKESKFRSDALLATTVSDEFGRYKAKISGKYLQNSITMKKRGMHVTASVPGGEVEAEIARSADFFDLDDHMVINLTSTTYADEASTDFQRVLTSVSAILSSPDTDIEDVLPAEYEYIASVTGYQPEQIRNIVTAYKLLASDDINEKATYALLSLSSNSSVEHVLSQDLDVIEAQLALAVDKNIVPTLSGDMTAIHDAIVEYKAKQLSNAKNSTENITNGEILSTILTGPQIALFFKIYVEKKNFTPEEMWDAFESSDDPESSDPDILIGAEKVQKLQTGIKLVRFTGFQPVMTANLLSFLTDGSLHISKIATLTSDEWRTMIGEDSPATIELSVPKYFWNFEGWEDEEMVPVIISNYADYLHQTAQRLYPTTTIANLIDDDTSNTIINDDTVEGINDTLGTELSVSDIKDSVTAFIYANPDFNLRYKSVHEISPEVENCEAVKLALAPFQRMLRVVGGRPEAVTQFITEGIDSATAVVNMGRDSFVSAYSARLGGPMQAAMAYDQAELNSAISASTAAGMYTYQDDTSIDVLGHMYPWLEDTPSTRNSGPIFLIWQSGTMLL